MYACAVWIGVVVAGALLRDGEERPGDRPGFAAQKPEFQAIAAAIRGGRNKYLGELQVRELEQTLAEDEDLAPARRAQLLGRLSREYLRLGEVTAARQRFVELSEFAAKNALDFLERPLLRLHADIALREAEVQNCVLQHNRDCCIFPLAGGGVHAHAEPAEDAAQAFAELLGFQPDNLSLVWLLNVSEMAAGRWPEGVPEPFRIPRGAFESEAKVGRFVDVAPMLGVADFNLCGGAVVEDLDQDGWLDLLSSTSDPSGPLRLHRSLGDGRFEDRSGASRLDDQLGGLNCTAADYDNDGDVDLLVLRGAWMGEDGMIRNSLLRNEGDGTFVDVTRAAGVDRPAFPTQTACFGDLDNDGDLDLYIGNEAPSIESAVDYPAQLFRNNGDGTFVDIAAAAGVENRRFCKGVAVGDHDNDGDLDLYVSNIGPNRLYRNDGDGHFTDVAPELGLTGPDPRSFATWFFDYDNDGWLDLFVAAYMSTLSDIAADYLGQPHRGVAPCLYRNRGDGTFDEVAKDVGLDHPWLPMGASFGDLDSDGWLDFYLATGDPQYETLIPNLLLRNDRGQMFQDVSTSAGVGHLQKGHGVCFADVDNDGDQDLYHQLGGFFPGDAFANALFRNPGHGNHFLYLKLRGTRSNRAGYGARIRVVVREGDARREIHRAVGSQSSFGGSPARQEIGLGRADEIELVELWWPRSDIRQRFLGVPLDRFLEITEGAEGWTELPLRSFPLGR